LVFLLKFTGKRFRIVRNDKGDSMNKQLIFGIIICLILVGAIVGYLTWQNQKQEANFIEEVDRKLSDEDRKIYEDRLIEAKKFIAEAQDNQAKSDALIYKAVQLSGLGKLAFARDVFLQAADVNPENFNIYIHLHLVYFEMEDFKSAESSIRESLRLNANNPDAWKKYILLEIEKFDRPESEIRELYGQAEGAVREKTDIYTDYARYLETIGDKAGAIQQWQKAAESYPENKDLYEGEIERLSS